MTKVLRPVVCLGCGQIFYSWHYRAKFHSTACRNLALARAGGLEIPASSVAPATYPDVLLSAPVDQLSEEEKCALERLKGAEIEGFEQYVYLFYDAYVTKLHKIGISKNPRKRMDNFNAGMIYRVVFMRHVIPTPDMAELEKRLHHIYRAKQANGEWYQLDESDVKEIKDM